MELEKFRRNKRNKHKQYNGVKLMFEDEAGFGRISDPAGCWAPPKNRPTVPSQRIRQYKTVYGAVSALDGDSIFLVLDKSDSENMNMFLKALAEKFPDDLILLCVDNASWHKSKKLNVPHNIQFFYLPPRTPEMNPIEIVWREIRKIGFKNKVFDSIAAVVEKFKEVVAGLTNEDIISITSRDWMPAPC
jgi:putative transposase